MNATVEIFRRPGQGSDYGFDPTTGKLTIPDGQGGETSPDPILLYRGEARAVNNKDWRARVRTQRGDMGTVHAVRFQIPIRTSPPIHAHDLVRVIEAEPDPDMTNYLFHVRNPMMSSNAWIRNLLCDVDAAHPQTLPEPYTAVSPPEVVSDGVKGPEGST